MVYLCGLWDDCKRHRVPWEVVKEAEVPSTSEGVRPGVGIDLAVDVLDVRFDSADSHDEGVGDLGVALPGGQQA